MRTFSGPAERCFQQNSIPPNAESLRSIPHDPALMTIMHQPSAIRTWTKDHIRSTLISSTIQHEVESTQTEVQHERFARMAEALSSHTRLESGLPASSRRAGRC